MRRSICVLAFVAACGGAAAPIGSGSSSSTTTTSEVTNQADEPPPIEDDDAAAFRRLATEVAVQSQRHVIGWGTVQWLGGDDDRPRRYATLGPDDLVEGRGAYLIEEAPGRVWLVSVYWDGLTQPFGATGSDEAAWTAYPENEISHGQGHRGGFDEVRFTLFEGQLMVVIRSRLNDERAGDTSGANELVGLESAADLQIFGPGATAAELLR